MTSIDDIFAAGIIKNDSYCFAIGDDWLSGRTVFGGMIAGLANYTLRQRVPAERALRSMQIAFIGPAGPGEIRFEPRVLRVGKAVTLADCTVRVGSEVTATVTAIYGESRRSALALQATPKQLPMGPEDVPDARMPPNMGPNFLQHFVQRWAVGAPPFSGASDPHFSIYLRHRDAKSISESHVVALLDAIPSPALSLLKTPAPASTLTWTIEFLEHDYDYEPNQWWRLDAHIDATRDGYVNHVCNAIDPRGRVAAMTRQIVVVYG